MDSARHAHVDIGSVALGTVAEAFDTFCVNQQVSPEVAWYLRLTTGEPMSRQLGVRWLHLPTGTLTFVNAGHPPTLMGNAGHPLHAMGGEACGTAMGTLEEVSDQEDDITALALRSRGR